MQDYYISKTVKPCVRETAIENGLRFLETKELIMLLIGSGIRDMPVERLAGKIQNVIESGSFDELVSRLMELEGVGTSRALAVAASLELGRRYNKHRGVCIKTPSDFVPLVQHYALQTKEHFLCASLDGAHEIIELRVVSVGTLNRTMIHPREVFVDAIKDRAAAVILCHNHPSGTLTPSQEDIAATRQLMAAAECLGIQVLDHIIVSISGYYSFLEQGNLFDA